MAGIRIRTPESGELSSGTQRLLETSPPLMLNSMVAHADTTAAAISELTVQVFKGLDLGPRLRELVILATANSVGYEYIWVQHVVLAAELGITVRECEAIRQADLEAAPFSEQDKALIRFAAAVATGPTVSDETFGAAHEHLTERQIVETIEVVGLYWMFGRIVTVLQIPTEPPRGHAVTAGIENMQSQLASRRDA